MQRTLLFFFLACCGACARRPLRLAVPAAIQGEKAHLRAEPSREAEASEEADGAREWFLLQRVPPGDTQIPFDRYALAREQIGRMHSYSISTGTYTGVEKTGARDLAGRIWTNLGPGNVGGRTRSLVIHPQNPSIMYAGTVTGGVWKTTDAGQTWSPLSDLLPILTVGSLVMDPANPNILYAGTGELYGGFQGNGIFKTTDGGASWTQLSATTNFNFAYVNKLVISPKNPLRVYAATFTGIWASTDGGTTWSQVLNTTLVNRGCDDLVMRADTATDYLFASCSGKTFADDYGIWRNTNAAGGGAWTQVHTAAHMRRTSLALAPSQPATIYALASNSVGTGNYSGGLLAVFRSTSSGDSGSWNTRVDNTDPIKLNTALLSDPVGITAPICNTGPVDYRSQGDYDNVIAVDPLDPNRVWAGGILLFRSDDGGANWGLASQYGVNPPRYLHTDEHIVAFHPGYNGTSNQTMYVGNDGGVYRTGNARSPVSTGTRGACLAEQSAQNQVTWTNLNNSYGATQFYQGAAYLGGLIYFGGTQDNGVTRGTSSGGINAWQTVTGRDGASVAIDPADANRILASTQNLSLNRSANGGSLVSAISGITEDPNSFPFIAALATDPNEGRRVFLGGRSFLWRSLDGAASWTAAAPVTNGGQIGSIAVSPADANYVLFGTSTGLIFRNASALSSTGSAAWVSSRPRFGFASGLVFDAKTPSLVYAVYSSFKSTATDAHVYKSFDGGVNWQSSDGAGSGALPDLPVHRLLIDPRDSSRLYLATDMGIFISTDAGGSWSRDADGFPGVVVDDLAMDQGPASNWLFAFSHGRGVFRVPLPGAPNTNCTYAVTPSVITTDGFGGLFPVAVTAPPGCAWAAIPGGDFTYSTFVTVQSPAQGTGNGTAYVSLAPNTLGRNIADTITIADKAVNVNQTFAVLNGSTDESAAALVQGVPFVGTQNTSTSFSAAGNATDPVHSCTGSRDFKTIWWAVQPTAAGVLQVRVSGNRQDATGNSGVVVTAYGKSAPQTELGCVIAPRDAGTPNPVTLKFNVSAGVVYLIEVSATNGSTVSDGGFVTILAAMGGPDTAISLTPATVRLTTADKQQFSAVVTNAPNQAVRWTLSPPVGTLSTSGLFTPPAMAEASFNVTITATSFADPLKSASATVTVSPPPIAISSGGIVNAATFQAGSGVSPGEVVTLFGSSMGPLALVTAQLTPLGFLSTSLGGTQVLFDGAAAPLVYSSAGQVSAIVPYSVAGKTSTAVTITRNGQTSAAVTLPVVATAPGLFTLFASGSGPAAMLNQDGVVNSSRFAAPRGSIVVFFGTGEGQTLPPGTDGKVAATVFPAPVANVSLTIGGQPAKVLYAGAAPSLVAGVLQVNAEVPRNINPGDAPVVLTVGGASIQADVTMSVLAPDPTRLGRIAYSNRGTADIVVKVFAPDESQASTATVAAGRNLFLGTISGAANDWGVQAGSSLTRVVGHVCVFQTTLGGYWQCTGNTAVPFL